ncbi:MAG: adenosylcobinamide-phosphate synthase CbiB [Bdellovibrionia bacterium]
MNLQALTRERIIISAIFLDLLFGDPRWLPHPVRAIGKMARKLERVFRVWVGPPFLAGLFATLCVYLLSYGVPVFTVKVAGEWSPFWGDVIAIYWIYSTIAIRDLIQHSMNVYKALKMSDLPESRRLVGMIVGRDTQDLPEREVVRACVESVSESIVDGVTAPLFFAVLGGPAGAVLYRAINTLDSIFGHRDERYEQFGKFAARMDDVANFVPARVTSPLVALSSIFIGLRPINSLRVLCRDGKKHPSPNSGLAEAAVAGALGVQLGGENFYQGERSFKALLGDPLESLERKHILNANKLMLFTTFFFCMSVLLLRKLVIEAWN